MAKKTNETAPIYVVRHGDKMVGEMEMDRELLRQIKEGERVRVDIRTGRIPSRLRFYWAFLREVVKATGCAPHEKALHSAVKLKTGFTEDILIGGFTVKVPASIAFENMDEQTFGTFLNEALAFIAREYGVVPEQTEKAA